MITDRRKFLRTSLLTLAAGSPVAVRGENRLPPPPTIQSRACIVVDAVTGESLFERSADQRRPVASTQKLLAALVLVETQNLDRVVTVEVPETKVEPTKLPLRPGEKLPLRELLNAMLVHSCNDCAHCVARSCGGSVADF